MLPVTLQGFNVLRANAQIIVVVQIQKDAVVAIYAEVRMRCEAQRRSGHGQDYRTPWLRPDTRRVRVSGGDWYRLESATMLIHEVNLSWAVSLLPFPRPFVS